VTIIDAHSPRRTHWLSQPAHNDNVIDGDDLSSVGVRPAASTRRKDNRLPPFTSALIWVLLAIIGWGLIALAINLL